MSNGAATAPVADRARSTSAVDLFSRLEERVVHLVERYREAQKTLEELDTRLREAESRASRLEAELAERDLRREALRSRLDRVIEWVRALEEANEGGRDADAGGAAEPASEHE